MNFVDYRNSLKKISVNDIKDIIDESLNQNEEIAFGFKNQRGYIFFGELMNGLVINPSIIVSDNVDNLCQELYDLLQNHYSDIISYGFTHNILGEYDLYVTLGNSVNIDFPNLNNAHRDWIFNKYLEIEKKLVL